MLAEEQALLAQTEQDQVYAMEVQSEQDQIQTMGSAMNNMAQTAISVGQETVQSSVAANTARAKNVEATSQEVTQA
ncbi:MAG: hypothetical protein ACREM6_12115 [Vulcanimicrobiaceae bacterium]